MFDELNRHMDTLLSRTTLVIFKVWPMDPGTFKNNFRQTLAICRPILVMADLTWNSSNDVAKWNLWDVKVCGWWVYRHSHSVDSGPVAGKPHRILFEMHILWSHLTDQIRILGVDPEICFNKPSSWLHYMVKFENYW